MLLFVPAFFLLLYGYALNFDVQNVRARRAGQRSHAGQPRAGVAFVNSGYFELVAECRAAASTESSSIAARRGPRS